MAKVVGKKAAAPARKPAKKQAARPASKTAAAKKPAAKAVAKHKASAKPAPKAKATPKKAVKPPKPASRPAKPVPKAKAAPAAKPAAPAKPVAVKPAVKPAHPAHPAHPPKPVAAKPVAVPAPPKVAPPAAKADDKKRTRRPRPKVTSSGPPTAAWFSKGDNKPRPSSFIPAPPRAEAPSLVAAPPASSDRLISAHELTEFVVRTVPVRIDIDAGGGRIYLAINPSNVLLKVGEGIEWDFRYIAGADVIIDELSIEFEKPAPFPQTSFRSRRPGAARPHRQLSGPVQKAAAGKTVQYVIRAFNSFKTELAVARPSVTIVA